MAEGTYMIRRSEKGAYWTMTRNGIFIGNYDSFGEAVRELEEIRQAAAEATDCR